MFLKCVRPDPNVAKSILNVKLRDRPPRINRRQARSRHEIFYRSANANGKPIKTNPLRVVFRRMSLASHASPLKRWTGHLTFPMPSIDGDTGVPGSYPQTPHTLYETPFSTTPPMNHQAVVEADTSTLRGKTRGGFNNAEQHRHLGLMLRADGSREPRPVAHSLRVRNHDPEVPRLYRSGSPRVATKISPRNTKGGLRSPGLLPSLHASPRMTETTTMMITTGHGEAPFRRRGRGGAHGTCEAISTTESQSLPR